MVSRTVNSVQYMVIGEKEGCRPTLLLFQSDSLPSCGHCDRRLDIAPRLSKGKGGGGGDDWGGIQIGGGLFHTTFFPVHYRDLSGMYTCDAYFRLSLGLGSQKGVLAKAMIRGGYIETLNIP